MANIDAFHGDRQRVLCALALCTSNKTKREGDIEEELESSQLQL